MVDRLKSLSIPQWLLIAVAAVAAALMPWFGGHILVLGSLTATVIAVAYASAKHPLFGMVAGTVGIGVLGVLFLNFTGYCYDQRRYLDDKDLIRAAAEFILSSKRPGTDTISYTSVDDFLAQNPDCCRVRRADRGPLEPRLDGHWIRFFGVYVAAVEAVYKHRTTASDGHLESWISISACGVASEHQATPVTRSQRAGT